MESSREKIEKHFDMFATVLVNEIMDIPIEWVSDERLEEIKKCIFYNETKIFNKNFVKKLMEIREKIEIDKGIKEVKEVEKAL